MKGMRKNMTMALAIVATVGAYAQNTIKIDLGNARIARNLVETWISEYGKLNQGFSADIVDSPENADIHFSIVADHEDGATVVGQFLVLPISNSGSELLSDRKVRKGLNSKQLKDLFVVKDFADEFASDDDDKYEATVYSLAGRKSAVANLFAHHLGTEPSKLKGKKVVGQELSAVRKVQGDSTAVSFNVPSVVFDSDTRLPLTGLAVLPVDIDGNGRVSEEERQVIRNLDDLTNFVELAGSTGLPSGEIAVSPESSAARDFASWLTLDGQRFLKKHGFVGKSVKSAHK